MLLERFDGGPGGVEALAAAMAEDSGTLEDVIEPYLIQQGYVMRTARGRIATNMAYLQFGMTPPEPERQINNFRGRVTLPLFSTDYLKYKSAQVNLKIELVKLEKRNIRHGE